MTALDNQDTAFERDYDTVEQGHAQRITNPGHWTIWRNSEGFVSVRRYDREGDTRAAVSEDIIRAMYWEHLGREPEPEGLAAWVYHLDNGVDIGAIEACFVSNKEYRERASD